MPDEDHDASQDALPPAAPVKGHRPSPGRKMAAVHWLEVISLARAGVPVAKIAKSFKVKVSTIYRGLKKRGINIAGYQPIAAAVKESAERTALVERIKATKDKDYRYIEFLQQLVMTTVGDAKRAHAPMASIADNVKALKLAIDAVGNGTKVKWVILGLDRENENADLELPELPVREMTNDEVAVMRDKQILDDEAIGDTGMGALDDEDDDIVDETGSEDLPPGS